MASRMRLHGKWKEIKINPNAFIDHDLSGFVCMQELTDYDVISDKDLGASFQSKKNKKKLKKSTSEDRPSRQDNESQKKTASNKIGQNNNEDTAEEQSGSSHPPEAKRKKKIQKKVKQASECSPSVEEQSGSSHHPEPKRKKKIQKKVKQASECSPSKGTEIPLQDAPDVETLDTGNTSKKQAAMNKGKKRKLKGDSEMSIGKMVKTEQSHVTKGVHRRTDVLPDMTPWKDLFIPEKVLKALSEKNFTAPTPIQTLVLPPAIRDQKDIVGAAETGSGKTLAFGIPIIDTILRLKQKDVASQMETITAEHGADVDSDPESEPEMDTSDTDLPSTEEISDLESLDDFSSTSSEEQVTTDSEESLGEEDSVSRSSKQVPSQSFQEVSNSAGKSQKKGKPLYALILAPTRELAIQVRDHIQAAAKHTGIKVVAIVGGMAAPKQQRLLRKQPEIVVATPGRLWELLQDGEPHLSKVSDVRCLVIDEADRMVEKGHFEELTQLLLVINKDEDKMKHRQTFVFSATLTFVHSGPQRFKYKKRTVQMTEKQKLDDLMAHVGIKAKPKIVDLTRPVGTAETLTEARLNCTLDEKDIFLYYVLRQYPGRTLVFANSKDCIRRLVSILKLLQCCPLPLHADMHQRQRLKNLDRFKGNPKGLLMATDVAARGLDIPDVKHVIHYQVPRTTENYVHRSGRTARASKEGLSVMLVGPEDLQYYRKIIKSLNRDDDLPMFPVEQSILPAVRARVNTARHIDKLEHSLNKQKKQNSWYEKAARDMDIQLDEDELLNDLGDKHEQSRLKHSLDHHHLELQSMLAEPLERQNFLGKYPTKSGKLHVPHHMGDGLQSAVSRVKQAHKVEKKLVKKHSIHKIIKEKKKGKSKKKK